MINTFENAANELKTIIDFIRFGISQASVRDLYYGHGTDNAYDDIMALILGSLALPPDTDPLLFHSRLTRDERKMLENQLASRILEHVPVPYLTNISYFCGLSFYVDRRVLIPRSPIAELINLQFSPWIGAEKVHHILDLCTGSACLAIACHYAFPNALIDAVDLSEEALEVAQINCERHHVEDMVRLVQSDCWENLTGRRYDIILSNPPYVGNEEMDTLPEEYCHEPDMALRTGKDGLAIVEKILKSAHDYLSDDGILIVEVGNSDETLMAACTELPFTWLEFENGGHGVFLLTCQQLKAFFS